MPSNIDSIQAKIGAGREYRAMSLAPSEGEYIADGYATTFNQPYELWRDKYGCVIEQIDPHAFDDCDMTDVIMQYDHMGRVFARTRNGTLQVTPDSVGLKVRAQLGGTELGRQLHEEIKGGYTDRMSFGFIVAEDKREIVEDKSTGFITINRTITKISKLFDVSAVSIPANDATSISARNLGDGVIREILEERQRRASHKLNIIFALEV